MPTLRRMVENKPGLTLLDVGAGSGTISVALAKAVPDGQVTAVDVKADILPRARAIASSASVRNIEFEQADGYKLPFPNDAFDVTHCHQVLAHLKEPWTVLAEMIRVTKPGGVVACREGDLETEFVWPELSGLRKFHDLAAQCIRMVGGSSAAGRQLLSWALKAGVERSKVTTSFGAWGYSETEERRVWGRFCLSCSVALDAFRRIRY